MMTIVLAAGVCLHVTIAAWRAYRSGSPHLHSAIRGGGGNPGNVVAIRSEGFWPAFLRRATGCSSGSSCFMGGEMLMEMCELANPEIRIPSGPNCYVPKYTAEQQELVEKLSREYWSRWNQRGH
jgi:hypothetical protein